MNAEEISQMAQEFDNWFFHLSTSELKKTDIKEKVDKLRQQTHRANLSQICFSTVDFFKREFLQIYSLISSEEKKRNISLEKATVSLFSLFSEIESRIEKEAAFVLRDFQRQTVGM